jgi:hypothetical protein
LTIGNDRYVRIGHDAAERRCQVGVTRKQLVENGSKCRWVIWIRWQQFLDSSGAGPHIRSRIGGPDPRKDAEKEKFTAPCRG